MTAGMQRRHFNLIYRGKVNNNSTGIIQNWFLNNVIKMSPGHNVVNKYSKIYYLT